MGGNDLDGIFKPYVFVLFPADHDDSLFCHAYAKGLAAIEESYSAAGEPGFLRMGRAKICFPYDRPMRACMGFQPAD